MWLLNVVFERKTLIRAIFVALIVGVILNLINQGDNLIHLQFNSINYTKLLLTFFVPYSVSTYSSVMSKVKFEVGEISFIDTYLECNCGKTIFIKKGEIIPECKNCKSQTKYNLAIRKAAKLKRKEEKLESKSLFVELNPSPVFRFNNNGIITEANPAFTQLYNSIIIGENILNIITATNKLIIHDIISNEKIETVQGQINGTLYRFNIRGVKELSSCFAYGFNLPIML